MIPGSNNKRRMSEESKLKNAASHVGKTLSEETRAKISKASRGRTLSEEARAKISKALKGRPGRKGVKMSKEQCEKIAAARRVYRRYKVTFEDGRTETYGSAREAAEAAGCWPNMLYSYAKHGVEWHGMKFEVE